MNSISKIAHTFIKYIVMFVLLALIIACIIKPSIFEITTELIFVIGFVCMILFSEEFNSLALGKILTISRDVKHTQEKVNEVKQENDEIKSLIVKYVLSMNQQNTTITNVGVGLESLKVIPANNVTNDDSEKTLEKESNKIPGADINWNLNDWRKIQKATIERYMKENDLPLTELRDRIKFSHSVEELNPIIKQEIVYDGYLKSVTSEDEVFFEVRNLADINKSIWDRIYVMLSQLHTYRKAKGIQAYMVLLFIEDSMIQDEENKQYKQKLFERFCSEFSPARTTNLLRIQKYSFTHDEIENIKKTVD